MRRVVVLLVLSVALMGCGEDGADAPAPTTTTRSVDCDDPAVASQAIAALSAARAVTREQGEAALQAAGLGDCLEFAG